MARASGATVYGRQRPMAAFPAEAAPPPPLPPPAWGECGSRRASPLFHLVSLPVLLHAQARARDGKSTALASPRALLSGHGAQAAPALAY